MKVLITGGAGFIGGNISVRLADAGWKVGVVTRNETVAGHLKYPERSIEFYFCSYGDERMKEILKEYDFVIHLAGTSIPENSTLNPQSDIDTNVMPSVQFLKYCIEAKIRKVVFISTGGVIYGQKSEFPILESAEPDPYSSYGISKLMIEKYLWLHAQSGQLDACILRVANVYGPNVNPEKRQGVIPVWLNAVKNHQPITIMGDGKVVRDYIFIEDLVEAFKAVLDNDLSGIYNLGTGIGTDLNELIEIIEDITSSSAQVNRIPSRKFDVPVNILSCEKFKQATGWKPQWNIRKGIEETWKKLH